MARRWFRRRYRPTATVLPGTVYLICADRPIGNPYSPYGQARHYIGWTLNIERRIHEQRRAKPRLTKAGKPRKRQDRGARLCAAWNAAGIRWRVARTWVGDRGLERYLKRQKHADRYCPYCRGEIMREQFPLWHIPWACNREWPEDLPF